MASPLFKKVVQATSKGLSSATIPIILGNSVATIAIPAVAFGTAKRKISPKEGAEIVKENLKDVPVEFKKDLKNNAFFDADKNRKRPDKVILPEKQKIPPAVVYHEMGHAKDFEGKDRKKKITAYQLGMAGMYGALTMPALNAVIRSKPTITKHVLSGMSGALGILSGIPVIRAERQATEHALKLMKEKGYSKKDIKESEKLLKAVGSTYRLVSYTPALAAAADISGKLLGKLNVAY